MRKNYPGLGGGHKKAKMPKGPTGYDDGYDMGTPGEGKTVKDGSNVMGTSLPGGGRPRRGKRGKAMKY